MKITQRLGRIPDGDTPLAHQSVQVRTISDGSSLATLTTDDDGFITLQRDGHYEPFYFLLDNIPGGDKFWRSDESHTVGVWSPKELPVALRVLGDGVVRGYEDELAVALVSGGPNVTVAPGAALVAGHPVVVYTGGKPAEISRPVSGTRVDRVILRLYPEGSATTPGKADTAILSGTIDAGTPALTQTATVYEISLAKITIPSAGTITLTDERVFANETAPVTSITRSDAETTSNASGEVLTNLNGSLSLVRTATYDIRAEVSGLQINTVSWVRQAVYGSFGAGTAPNFSAPGQLAHDSSGRIWVTDVGNNRAVRLAADGSYDTAIALPDCRAIAVDSSDAVYIAYSSKRMAKYNSSLVLQWDVSYGAVVLFINGISVDASQGFVAAPIENRVYSFSKTTGVATLVVSGSGSGNGQMHSPIEVVSDNSFLYVSDRDNFRIQKFTTAGVYVAQWGSSGAAAGDFGANGPRGLALDASGNLWVADPGNNRLQKFSPTGTFLEAISQSSPAGVTLTTGDVLWVSNSVGANVAKWDEAPAGYGGLAVEINGNLGTYITLGDVTAPLQNAHTQSVSGPATVTVKAYGKATSGAATFKSVVLSACAVPRA
jgi:sugar lactone lactonase YvrE